MGLEIRVEHDLRCQSFLGVSMLVSAAASTASIAVCASSTAPSRTARSAAGVTTAAAKAGWWLTAGSEPCQLLVVAELRIARTGLDQLPLASGRQGARLEACPHSFEDTVELRKRVRAHVPGATGDLGDRIGRCAGLGDDAVHAHRWGQLLPKQADGDLRDREGVSRIATEMGVGARV